MVVVITQVGGGVSRRRSDRAVCSPFGDVAGFETTDRKLGTIAVSLGLAESSLGTGHEDGGER